MLGVQRRRRERGWRAVGERLRGRRLDALEQRRGRRGPPTRVEAERVEDHGRELGRHAGAIVGRELRRHPAHGVALVPRQARGEHQAQQQAELVEVRRDGRALPEQPLGRHIRRGPSLKPCAGRGRRRASDLTGDAEVEQDQAIFLLEPEHILRLDVAVHEADRVQRGHGARDVLEQGESAPERQGPVGQPGRERAPFEPRHDDERPAAGQAAGSQHRDQRVVRHRAHALGLGDEALDLLVVDREVGVEHLERDLSLAVSRGVDEGAAALAEQPSDLERTESLGQHRRAR